MMRIITRSTRAVAASAAAGLFALTFTGATSSAAPAAHPAKPTIVLVHGAWADSSTWKGVVTDLQRKGYTVDVPPNPLRGVASDARYLDKYLATITGPLVLVGHSYGGTVISNAAVGHANVKALVYDDAFIPKKGETLMDEIGAEPGSLLAVPPQDVFNFVPLTNKPTGPVDLYVKPGKFAAVFAANLPATRTKELAATQSPLINTAVDEPSGAVAWARIPSWDVIGLKDKLIPPAEQLAMAARAHSHVVKIEAPHLSLVTNPSAVANTIIRAATATA